MAEVRILPHAEQPGSWQLVIDGIQQSSVDTADPTRLHYQYMRRIASVVDTMAPEGTPLRVLHLGGGALTLARYIAVTRPGSRQLVVEKDEWVDTLVRDTLPLPGNADVTTTIADARAWVDAAVLDGMAGRFDLVVTDVYDGAKMPAEVASLQFDMAIRRMLTERGAYVVNVADRPPMRYSRTQAATLRRVFETVCAIAEPGMLRGSKYGNIVLAAGAALPIDRIAGIAARDEIRGRVLSGTTLDDFVGRAGPMYDASSLDAESAQFPD